MGGAVIIKGIVICIDPDVTQAETRLVNCCVTFKRIALKETINIRKNIQIRSPLSDTQLQFHLRKMGFSWLGVSVCLQTRLFR